MPPRKKEAQVESNEKKTFVYQLVGKRKPETYILQGSDLSYFDEEKKQRRQLRYAATIQSVFVDEQPDFVRRTPVEFEDGVLVTSSSYPNLVNYLDKHPGNVANGGKIFELKDAHRDAEKLNKAINAKYEALRMVMDREKTPEGIEELTSIASVLGYDTTVKSQMFADLKGYAESAPEQFMSMFNNEMVKAKRMVIEAIELNILDTYDPSCIKWNDNKEIVCTIPVGMENQHTDIMARFILSDDGIATKNELKRRIDALS